MTVLLELLQLVLLLASASAQGGPWSEPTTWADGEVPAAGDAVVIEAGHVVVYDVAEPVKLHGVTIEGRLAFDPQASLELRTNASVVVRNEGRLTMRPADHDVRHLLRFVDVDEAAFKGAGDSVGRHGVAESDVGLWIVDHGQLDTHGSAKTPWSRLVDAAAEGERTIAVEDATGWQVGDRLEIAPTLPPTAGEDAWKGYDSVTVAAVEGEEVTLDQPLAFDHPQVNGRWRAEVLNLTRNVVIAGTEQGRAHIIFNHFRQPQQMSHVEIKHMGPRQADGKFTSDVTGRYGLHFHHGREDARGSLIENVVVHSGGAHAFVPHASHGMTFRGTISHDTFDDAYWWDPGEANATDDVVWERTVASMAKSDPAFRGYRLAGYRLGPGENNTVREAVAVGIRGNSGAAGYVWPEDFASVWNFSEDNLAHNNATNGIFTWQNTSHDHVVENFTAYHNGHAGVEHGAYVNHYVYRDAELYGNGRAGFLLHATSRPQQALTIEDIRFDGADISEHGLEVIKHTLPGGQETLVRNSHFQDVNDAAVAFTYTGDPDSTEDERMLLVGNTFADGLQRYHLSDEIRPGSLITVHTADGERFELRRADQTGTRVPEWNARRTDLSSWRAPKPSPRTIEESFTGEDDAAWPERWLIVGEQQTVTLQDGAGEMRYGDGGGVGLALVVPEEAEPSGVESVQEVTLWAPVVSIGMRGGLVARRADDAPGDYYVAELARTGGDNGGQRVRLGRVIDGEPTTLAEVPDGNAWEADGRYRLKFDVRQLSAAETLLRVRCWPADETEPSEWDIEQIDTATALQNRAGRVGLLGKTVASERRHWLFDDYTATQRPERLEDRSVR